MVIDAADMDHICWVKWKALVFLKLSHGEQMLRHLQKFPTRHPPGDEIYRNENVCMFEVRMHAWVCGYANNPKTLNNPKNPINPKNH